MAKSAGDKPRFVHPPLQKSVTASYPTPLVEDAVLVVTKETNTPNYVVEAYGTPHPDYNRFPDHKLSLIRVSDDSLKAQWFYVADRDSQDAYNYAITRKLEDESSLIYVRQYVLPRDGYEPVHVGTPDSAYAQGLLTDEKVLGPADGEWAALFIKVVRTFEVIPGPIMVGAELDIPRLTPLKFITDDRTDITEQEVVQGTNPDPITTEGSKSSVKQIDTIRSQKVTEAVTTDYRTDPIPSFEQTPQGQIAEVEEQLVDEGTLLPPVTALTIDSSSEALGNGKAVQKVSTVDEVFGENTFATDRPDLTPPEFRALIPTETRGDVEAGTAALPNLQVGELSHTEEQITVQKKRVRSSSRSAVDLPAVLTESEMTPQGQVGTVTKTLDNGEQTFTPDELTIKADVQNLGDGRSVLTEVTVPDVFGENTFARTRPDVVPERFRVAVPTSETSEVIAGTAADPTLGTGDLEKSEEQVTEFKKRLRARTRAGITLPISLQGRETSQVKQDVLVTDTLQSELSPQAQASAIQDVKVQNLGDGTVLVTTEAVPDVFGQNVFEKSIPDALPTQFRVTVPTSTTEETVSGTAADPTLGTGDLSKSESQVTEFTKRLRTTGRAGVTLPVSLVSSKQTSEGQVETVTATLDNGLQVAAASATIIESEVINLGNNTSLKTQGVVAEVFGREEFGEEIPDVVPVKFRVAVPTQTVALDEAGTATDPTLGPGDLSITEQQRTEFVKRITTRGRADVSLPISLASKETSGDKQVVTVTQTYKNAGGDALPTATQTVEVENLGDGRVVQTVKTVPDVFGHPVSSVAIPDLIPQEFRPFVPTETFANTAAGTIAVPPVLGTGELSRKEEQVDEFTLRRSIETRAGIALPVTHTNKELTREFGGGLAKSVLTLEYTGTGAVDEGYDVLDSSIKDLGNGTEFKETKRLNSGGWPIVASELWDDNMRMLYVQTEQVVPVGTVPDPNPGYPAWLSEIKPIDKWRSRKIDTAKTPIHVDAASALVSYEFKPYRFPGLLTFAGAGYYVRSARADLCRHKIKTWFVSSGTTPSIAFDEVVMDNPVISSLNDTSVLAYAGDCLHDDLVTFTSLFFPATTPSATEYRGLITGGGTWDFTAGSNMVTGFGTAFLTDLQSGDIIVGLTGYGNIAIDTIFTNTSLSLTANFPVNFPGGNVAVTRPSIAWIGNYKIIGASVTPEREKNTWKIQTESVVMR